MFERCSRCFRSERLPTFPVQRVTACLSVIRSSVCGGAYVTHARHACTTDFKVPSVSSSTEIDLFYLAYGTFSMCSCFMLRAGMCVAISGLLSKIMKEHFDQVDKHD